jgi:hypothetical protein
LLKERKLKGKDCLKWAKSNCLIREGTIQNNDQKYEVFIKSLTPIGIPAFQYENQK